MTRRAFHRVVFQPATYQGMQKGIEQMVAAIRPTLGPLPRIVAIERTATSQTPELVDEGAIVARRIVELADRDADVGAMFLRHVLWNVHESVGDGTATAAVLFQSIFDQGTRYVVAGGDAMQMRRFFQDGIRMIHESLNDMSVRLEGKQELAQIAESICHDRPLALLLGEIFDIIGEFGQLEIRSAHGRELEREYVEGMYWNSGFFSPRMITNHAEQKTELHNAAILVSDLELNDPRSLARLLEAIIQAETQSLMIIAKKLSDDVTGLLTYASGQPEKFQVCAVKTPGATLAEQASAMEDLIVLVGGRSVVQAAGNTLAGVRLEDLGSARRVWADRFHFGVVGGKGDPRRLRGHIADLRAAFERTSEVEARRRLQERIGKLLGGSATLSISAPSKSAIKQRRDLAERTSDALRGAVREGVVPGGGVSLLACRPTLRKRLQQSDDVDEHAAYYILIKALEAPIRAILTNAGYDASEIMAEIRLASAGHGFDVRSGQVTDMVQAGIWDATTVLKTAVHSAVASAALALTTDVLVHHKKREQATEP